MIYLIGSSIIKKWKFPLECINLGIGGLLTSQLINIDINEDDSLVFYCGGNDIRKLISIKEIYNNIVNFFISNKCKDVYIISIVKCKKIYDINRSDDVDILNNIIRDFCDINSYRYIESNLIFSYCSNIGLCSLCKSDGIHLETDGYEKLENLFYTNF